MNGFNRTLFEKERESKAEKEILASSVLGKGYMLKMETEVTAVNLSYLICILSGDSKLTSLLMCISTT